MPPPNKLEPYKEEIMSLRESGMSAEKIRVAIQQKHGIEVSRKHVYVFIANRSKQDAFSKELEANDFEFVDKWSHGWLKTDGASIFIKNQQHEEDAFEALKEDFLAFVSSHAPAYPFIDRNALTEPHLLVVDPCDVHIGKLASIVETREEYNNSIAVQRVREGVDGIISKSAPYNVDKVLLIAGNDILHIDTVNRTTTAGTPQDTDGTWHECFMIAKMLLIEVIEKLMAIADVHVVFNPSNHDFMSGFFLLDSVKSWFRNCENVTWDSGMTHRKYFKYHENLIGTTHGDGAKQADLPLLMASESGEMWLSKHRYIYGHHVHHKIAKDYIGVSFEAMRSASSADGWHSRKGYQHAPKAMEGFLHHPMHGQVSRITHIF